MRRSPVNPILTRGEVPELDAETRDVSAVLAPGAATWDGRTLLLAEVLTRAATSVWMPAWSDDGVRFSVEPRRVGVVGIEALPERVHRVRSPRLVVLDGALVVSFVAETDDAVHVGLARGMDPGALELLSLDFARGARHAVLFPAGVGGRHLRVESAARVADAPADFGRELRLAESDDLVTWRDAGPLLAARPHGFDVLLAPGPPPVLTSAGWLLLTRAAVRAGGGFVQQVGAVVLDATDPTRVVGRASANVLEPREAYETTGRAPNAIEPGGAVVDRVDGDACALPDARVRLYYGCAGTCVALASASVAELLAACDAA